MTTRVVRLVTVTTKMTWWRSSGWARWNVSGRACKAWGECETVSSRVDKGIDYIILWFNIIWLYQCSSSFDVFPSPLKIPLLLPSLSGTRSSNRSVSSHVWCHVTCQHDGILRSTCLNLHLSIVLPSTWWLTTATWSCGSSNWAKGNGEWQASYVKPYKYVLPRCIHKQLAYVNLTCRSSNTARSSFRAIRSTSALLSLPWITSMSTWRRLPKIPCIVGQSVLPSLLESER